MKRLVRYLATEPSFQGVGHARAARLAERFGTQLGTLLDAGDPGPFIEVVGASAAAKLVAAWRADRARGTLADWLDENGFGPILASKITKLWGPYALSVVQARPYALMAVADWQQVDAAAIRLGIPRNSPMRRIAAVEAVLYARLHRQHTWTPHELVVRDASKLLSDTLDNAEVAVTNAADVGAAHRLGEGWQPAGAAMMEQFVAERVRSLIAEQVATDLVAAPVDRVMFDRWLSDFERMGGRLLDSEQRNAAALPLRQRFGLVLGGAGVGKTTAIEAMCAACEAFGRAVHLVALAGRAAARMRELTGRPATTVAAFLRAVQSGSLRTGGHNVIIVDEASMIDLPTFYRLCRSVHRDSSLVLVGDDAQIGPIGFGLVQKALIEVKAVPRVVLRRVYRQEADGIPLVAAAIRSGRTPRLELPKSTDGVFLYPVEGEPDMRTVLEVVSGLQADVTGVRILSPIKRGPIGTTTLNARFRELAMSGGIRSGSGGFLEGEPVMFIRNDYQRDLRNGSLGRVTDVDAVTVVVDFGGVRHSFAGAELSDLQPAYAITIHKAQGSQFDTLVIPVSASGILDRSLVYTAITRAVRQAVLVGDPRILAKAVAASPHSSRRMAGLAERLVSGNP